MILEWLAANPHTPTASSNDLQALEWIKEIGLEKDFPPESKTRSFFFGYALHPSHWIVGGVLHGMKDASRNGHLVCCFPKSQYTSEHVKDLMAHGGSGLMPKDPALN